MRELLSPAGGITWLGRKSKKFYADKAEHITEDEVDELIKEIRSRDKDEGEHFLKEAW